jgi:CubicO group peptidase (beta-lactamase class C family)
MPRPCRPLSNQAAAVLPALLAFAWALTALSALPAFAAANPPKTAPKPPGAAAPAVVITPEAAIAEIERTLDARLIRPDQPAPPGLTTQMRNFSLPAVSVAVIRKGEIHWARAWGEARPGVPATADTRFSAGSISKPVGALAALRLAEARGIAIDADLRPMLKRWQPAAEDGPPRYTLRRLLSHSASLSTHGFGGYAADAPLPTIEQILDGLPPANSPAVRPLSPPVSGFKYSGGGSTIVQLWVEEQTGLPYAQAMQTWVLQPLGMRQSAFEQPPREALAQHAFSHQGVGKPEPGGWRVYPEMEAAGLWATPSDLARMLIAVQKARGDASTGTDATGAGGLSGSVARTATERVTERTSPGFFLDGKRFGHNGSNQGFESAALIGAETGDGVVIMINSQNSWALVDALVRTVARVYGWPEMAAPRAAAQQRLGAQARRWEGSYTVSDGSTISLRMAQGTLWLQPGPGAWERLVRTTDGRFTTERAQPMFSLSDAGLRGMVTDFGEPLDPSLLSPRKPVPKGVPEISMRGSLSNWQPGAVLKPVGKGRYVAEIDIPAGKHEFKIADAQWQRVNLGGTGPGAIQPGTWTTLQWQGGNLLVDNAQPGRWRLELDAPDRPTPARLRLTRLPG